MNKETLENMKKGSEDAFNEFVEEYRKIIFAYALTVLRDRETAEEVTQKTMIRVYEKVEQLDDLDSFIYWLFKTTYRICLDELKMKDRIHEVGIDKDLIENYAVHHDENSTYGIVWEALDELPDKSRFMIVGKYVFEFSEKEIAEMMALPTGTVKSRLYYARQEFKDILSKRDIREAHLSVVLTPSIITWAISSIDFNTATAVPTNVVPNIVAGKEHFFGELGKSTKLLAAGVGVVSVGSISYFALKPEAVEQPVIPPCIVEQISWDDSNYQQEIKINASLTCDEPFKVLIDGEEGTLISSNGEHTIEIKKDGVIIETKTINIDKIDDVSPVIINTDYDLVSEVYTLYLQDEESGLSPRVDFFINDQSSNDYNYDESSGVLTFMYRSSNKYDIQLYDNAGNILDFTVHEIE